MNRWVILILFLSVLLLSVTGCTVRLDENGFKVSQVVDGNTLLLENGYQAVLLGITPTSYVQKALQSYVGKTVYFVFDSSSDVPESDGDEQKFFAYVLDGDYEGPCINSALLKEGISPLNESPNLVDSLDLYRNYAQAYKGQAMPQIVPPSPLYENENIDDITIPPYNPDSDNFSQMSYWSDDKNENCNLLKHVCDYNNSCTRDFAVQLAKRSEGKYNIGQVCEIFKYLYNKWRYVNDPIGSDYVARASESISQTHFSGDCDDFAVLMASCILAIGGNVRINIASNEQSCHAFCELNISNLKNSSDEVMDDDDISSGIAEKFPNVNIDRLYYRVDNDGKWLNLDWTASYPGGKYFNYSTCESYELNTRGQIPEWIYAH